MEKIFQTHRMALIDLHAALQKEELQLEPLIESDQPDEAKVSAQIDRVANARAALEKSNAMMFLGIRKRLPLPPLRGWKASK
jgi:periplasmic protein CpxP/Spy